MPSYVSHTIMAREVYNKLDNKSSDLSYMLTFSLGGDLTKFAKCRYDSHRLNKREEFFNNLIKYIKDNSLEKDPKVLGFLYGHLCHYALDDLEHPLIRKLCKTCKPNKKNHPLIELYYDNYLTMKKYGIPLNKYDNNKLFKGKINKTLKNVIDYTYFKTYNCKNVSKYYKLNLFLYKKIKILYRLFPISFLKKIIGIEKFLKINKNVDMLNSKHEIEFRDINNKEINKDFDNLYNEAIKKALKDIKEVNKKLYDKI